jgi:hypothetical protein
MSASELDPVDKKLAPLAQAIGRAVLGAAALEKVLLVDIARRRAESEGLTLRLGQQLSRLELQPAGELLRTLRELGIPSDVANRIEEVIGRRNNLVHRFMEDREVAAVFMTGEGTDRIVERVDKLAADCQRLINEIGPSAFSGVEGVLGATLPELLAMAKSADLDAIEDDQLRAQLRWARDIDADQLDSLASDSPGEAV